jgi:hypothetical protein
MSTIIDFFVAPDDAAAAGVVHGGPRGTFETVTYGNFDVFLALGEWDAAFGAGTGSTATTVDDPDVVAGGDPDPWILAVPPGLVRALAGADRPALAAAERWVHDQAAEGIELDAQLFTEMFDELAGLARTATESGGSTCCWVC